MPEEKEDIPRLGRKLYESARMAEEHLRSEIKDRAKCYVGDQWDPREKARRETGHRPALVINMAKPPCDAIETNIRVNPPSPICHPVGDPASDETADVIAGMIRQIEYSSNAPTIYSQAGRDSVSTGYGIIEYATRYLPAPSMDQELYIVPNEDPTVWWFDPLARRPNREDAMWAIKGPRILSQEAYQEAYGKKHKVFDGGFMNTVQSYAGQFRDMLGWSGDYGSMNMWTTNGKGPFWVAEFWRITITLKTLRMYTDNIARYDGEERAPEGVKPKTDESGSDKDYVRRVPRRKVMKYIIDACEVLEETEWVGDHIPALTVLGPEVWIDGKLHRLSLIHGMIDSQRAFNYIATSMTEIAGKVPKAPWLGTKGQFIDEKWATASIDDWVYLEATPVEMVSELTNSSSWAPPPTRNMMEAPIQWLIQLGTFFQSAMQSVSSYSANVLGKAKADQSGRAIEALQSESQQGNYSYPDGVNRAAAVMYQQWLDIIPVVYSKAQAQTIIRADGEHEKVLINQIFNHPVKKNDDGSPKRVSHDLALGRYSVRVHAGPSPETRNDEALDSLGNMFKAAPQLLTLPGVAAAYAKLLGQGNPKVTQMATLFPGGSAGAQTPEHQQAELQQAQQQNQQLQALVAKLQQAIQSKLPQVEAEKFKTLIKSLTDIRVAEINASKDVDNKRADIEASQLETMLGLSHDAGTAAAARVHDAGMQANDQAHQLVMSDQAHQQALQQHQSATPEGNQ